MFRIRTCAETKGSRNIAQEVAVVALAISDNFLPKIFSNWLCEMSNHGNSQQTS